MLKILKDYLLDQLPTIYFNSTSLKNMEFLKKEQNSEPQNVNEALM